jgi:hypothetical protein
MFVVERWCGTDDCTARFGETKSFAKEYFRIAYMLEYAYRGN